MREIKLREAEARPASVVDDALRGKPSIITRHGLPEAVILVFEGWKRLSTVPSFGRLLRVSGLSDGDLPLRDETPLRAVCADLVDIDVLSAAAPDARADARRKALARWLEAASNHLSVSVVTVAVIEDGATRAVPSGATRKGARRGPGGTRSSTATAIAPWRSTRRQRDLPASCRGAHGRPGPRPASWMWPSQRPGKRTG